MRARHGRRSKRCNPSGALLGIGLLTSLEILNPATGKATTQNVRGKWLAWDPSRKAFHICTVKGRAGRGLPATVVKAHKSFHSAAPRATVTADVPASAGGERQVGLVKALTYRVPAQVNSPEKNPHLWHHAFGDTGHKGGDDYPQKVMPALVRDRASNLFIRRRPGNIFRVDTWLRG